MPKNKNINIVDDDDIVENKQEQKPENEKIDVLVASDYHTAKQHEPDPEMDSEDELLDYLKQQAKNVFESEKEEAIKQAKESGQPFKMDYSEKAVPIMPVPSKITTNAAGQEIPTPVSPWDPDLESGDVAMVCFTPDNKPLYEDDKKTVKKVKSTDSEYKTTIDDEHTPIQIKEMNNMIRKIVQNWERKHPLVQARKNIILDKNKKAINMILKFVKLNENDFSKKLKPSEIAFWKKAFVQDADLSQLMIQNNVNVQIDKTKLQKFVSLIKEGKKRKIFDLPKAQKTR